MLHKKTTFYFALAGIAAAAAMAARLNVEAPIQPPPITPASKPYASSLAASGIVETFSENISLGVAEPGLVAEVHVKVWDKVEAGQPLLTLDTREITAQLRVHEANVTVAAATLRRLQDQLARLKSVNDLRAVSADELRTRENDVAVGQAQLEAARAQAAETATRRQRLTMLAPRDGTIIQVNIRPGEYATVSPKSAPLVLGDIDRLQIRAEIDEQNAPRLQPGQAAIAYLKGDAADPIALRFIRIEPYVVPKVSLTGASTERVDTRVLQVIYAFDRPPQRKVYVGQQVDLFIQNDSSPATAERFAKTATTHKGQL